MSMLYTFFDDSCKYQHFLSYPQKWQFQIRHPYKGAESTGCLVFQFLLFLEFELFAHNEREHALRLQAHVMTPSCIMMKLNSAAKWKLGDTRWPGRHSFCINASMHRCCDSEILVKFAVVSVVQLRVFRWGTSLHFSMLSFPDLPRSSQIFPASLNFAYPQCLSFRMLRASAQVGAFTSQKWCRTEP